ncbi:MAG TPA: DUF58 domain-containing protein, partial [Acidimicrobiales bacterium]|nr:DUF58 domain-containing protein [Acidimicrobiales bacterium]
ARPSLRLAVEVPVSEVSVGDTVSARLAVSSRGSGLPRLLIEGPARCWSVSHPGLGGRPVPTPARQSAERRAGARFVRDVPRGTVATLDLSVPTSRRGVVMMRGLRVWSTDPLGLFALPVGQSPGIRVLVCPIPEVNGPENLLGSVVTDTHPAASSPSAWPVRPAGDELDFLRPYVPGDRLTRLHWQSLARTGDLMVREFAAGAARHLAILVDVRPGADTARLEAAISTAASAGVRALDEGTAVELCTSAGERMTASPGGEGRRHLLRALAVVGPSRPPRDEAMRWGWHSGDALWATSNRAEAGQVLITTRSDGPDSLPAALALRTAVWVVP